MTREVRDVDILVLCERIIELFKNNSEFSYKKLEELEETLIIKKIRTCNNLIEEKTTLEYIDYNYAFGKTPEERREKYNELHFWTVTGLSETNVSKQTITESVEEVYEGVILYSNDSKRDRYYLHKLPHDFGFWKDENISVETEEIKIGDKKEKNSKLTLTPPSDWLGAVISGEDDGFFLKDLISSLKNLKERYRDKYSILFDAIDNGISQIEEALEQGKNSQRRI